MLQSQYSQLDHQFRNFNNNYFVLFFLVFIPSQIDHSLVNFNSHRQILLVNFKFVR